MFIYTRAIFHLCAAYVRPGVNRANNLIMRQLQFRHDGVTTLMLPVDLQGLLPLSKRQRKLLARGHEAGHAEPEKPEGAVDQPLPPEN